MMAYKFPATVLTILSLFVFNSSAEHSEPTTTQLTHDPEVAGHKWG